MPDSGEEPPRKKKRAKRREPDFVIDPSRPNATIELETADLLQLGQSGLVQARANKTRELALSDLEELREGMPIQDPKVMVDLGPDPDAPPAEQNVFVDLGPEPAVTRAPTPIPAAALVAPPLIAPPIAAPPAAPPLSAATPVNVQRVTPTAPRLEVRAASSQFFAAKPRRGMGLVVIVYLLSAAALAVSIYLRWFA